METRGAFDADGRGGCRRGDAYYCDDDDFEFGTTPCDATTTTEYDDAVLYGAGDVIWPASEAFASLVAHVPSLVKGKRVIDVGCGLGLVSAAAILSENAFSASSEKIK